jgi:D-3-phosphoglycerate dehydrogenase / 2-oxoglutarate reductase
MKILVTCPPLLGMIDTYRKEFADRGVELTTPDVVQTLSEEELIRLVPQHDGWIIGDDPATRAVFEKGRAGRLRSAIKWGVGVDNVDFHACEQLGIKISNTPNMFGAEVADIALGYLIALARRTFEIDRGVRAGEWPKYRGISLAGRSVALVGLGDIGRNLARRLRASEMKVIAYDPKASVQDGHEQVEIAVWPDRLGEADFIIVTCSLTSASQHMLNKRTLALAKDGVRIINVSRGGIIDEISLVEALDSGKVYSAAMDVFEVEPLPWNAPIRNHPRCIFGAHNASNTIDAVARTSRLAIDKLFEFLEVSG